MYNMMSCFPCLGDLHKAAAIVVPVNHMDESKCLQAAPAPIKMEKPLQAPVQQVSVKMEKPPLQVSPVPVEMETPSSQAVRASDGTKKKTCPEAAANRKVRFADEEGKKDAVRITVLMTKKEAEQLLSMLAGGGRGLEDIASVFKATKRCAGASEHEGFRKSTEIITEGS